MDKDTALFGQINEKLRPKPWPRAEVYFIEPQKIDDRAPQVQTAAAIHFEGAWLHMVLGSDQKKIVTLPAHAVSRVEWSKN